MNKPNQPSPFQIFAPVALPDNVLGKKPSPYISVTSSSSTRKSTDDRSLSITSNIRQMIDGKITLSSMNKIYTSSHVEILSQDMECYTEDQDTFQTAYIYHKKNPNEFSDPSVGMDVDRNVSNTKKRGRRDN